MNDYERIAAIIRYIEETREDQPNLETLAEQVGLSTFHFHRLFQKWAGITPKAFLQSLTLAHARQLLQTGHSVLDAACAVGYSGPGRLHDLCVTMEAATPGELKTGGSGLTIRAGFSQSPLGRALIGQSPRGICYLAFVDDAEAESAAWQQLAQAWPGAEILRDDPLSQTVADQIFAGPAQGSTGERPPLRLYVKGSAFQVRVWRALLEIPAGSVRSYSQVAGQLGMPRSSRAVGSAVARNSIGYLIPCHRVIRESGVIGEYRWGATRKRAALALETAAPRD